MRLQKRNMDNHGSLEPSLALAKGHCELHSPPDRGRGHRKPEEAGVVDGDGGRAVSRVGCSGDRVRWWRCNTVAGTWRSAMLRSAAPGGEEEWSTDKAQQGVPKGRAAGTCVHRKRTNLGRGTCPWKHEGDEGGEEMMGKVRVLSGWSI